jgi:hypothetical protein
MPSTRALWFSGLAAALLLCALGWYLSPLKPGILALQLAFTPRAFGAVVHAWPPEHLALYRSHLPVDGLLLLAYGTWGYLFATRGRLLASAGAGLRRAATWALPAAAACDAVEDVLHWWLTAEPRFGMPLPHALAATAASCKWLLILVFLGLVVYALTGVPED